jgi:hypothetical protein
MKFSIKTINLVVMPILAFFVFATPIAHGHEGHDHGAEVVNEVSTEASSGGNQADGGETIIEGNSEASVNIKTEVNNGEVENVELKVKSDGQVQEMIKETTKNSDDGQTIIQTDVELKVSGQEGENSAKENMAVSIIKTVFQKIKDLFSWFI